MEIEGKIKEPSQVCMDERSLFCIRRVITSDLEEFQPKFSFDNKFIVVLNFGYSNQLKGGMYCDIINKNIMAEKED